MRDIKICIHVGLPKTATTTLQDLFFPHHSEIEYLGKYNNQHIGCYKSYRDRDTSYIFKNIQQKHIDENQANKLIQLLNDNILPRLDLNKTLVFSLEGISSGDLANRMRRAINYRSVFGDCKIMIMLREPLDLIEALYFEKLKWHNLKRRGMLARIPDCFSVEQWLGKYWAKSISGPLWNLDYYQTIKAYSDVFGKDNVGVFLFEHLKEDASSFIKDLCLFLGVDAEVNLDVLSNKRKNIRWDEKRINQLLNIQSSFMQSVKYRFSSHEQRVEALNLAEIEYNSSNNKARAEIPDLWKKRIQEYTSPGNRILASNWGLPLERYNYPL